MEEQTESNSTMTGDPRIVSLKSSLKEKPWDMNIWEQLLKASSNDAILKREIFEDLVASFPSSSQCWMNYIEFELENKNIKYVEALFEKCLRTLLTVDIWKLYVDYVRMVNGYSKQGSNTSEEDASVLEQRRATVLKAYEFTLNRIGYDFQSADLWLDYIDFLRLGRATSTFESSQQMDSVRKVFQNAVTIPMSGIEKVWKEYDAYENSLSKLTAKKFLSEKSAAYMTARSCLKDIRTFYESIDWNWVPKPPRGTEEEVALVSMFKKWILWEQSNPMRIEDKNILYTRVMFVFKQALNILRFFPEIWFEATNFLMTNGKEEEAFAIIHKGMEVMPLNLLVHFTCAEMEESKKNGQAKDIYEGLVTRYQEGIQDARKGEFGMSLDELIKGLNLVFIEYMNYARRAEGFNSARVIFSRARKSPDCTYQIFVFSALMEYFCRKDKDVPLKILDLGLKTFDKDENFCFEYLSFLKNINDDHNFKVVFERAISDLPKEKTRKMWDLYYEHESHFGDLSSALKLMERYKETFPQDYSIFSLFVQRRSFLSLSPLSDIENVVTSDAVDESLFQPVQAVGSQPMAPLIHPLSSGITPPAGSINILVSVGKGKLARPDLTSLVTLKLEQPAPRSTPQPSPQLSSTRPQYNLPQPLLMFTQSLPNSFEGPYYNVDMLMSLIQNLPQALFSNHYQSQMNMPNMPPPMYYPPPPIHSYHHQGPPMHNYAPRYDTMKRKSPDEMEQNRGLDSYRPGQRRKR